jgi:SAM-dependent methyltransferase
VEPPAQPSPWVQRWAGLIAPGSRVVDLAAGVGRHARWLAARGHRVLAVDRDVEALSGLASAGAIETRVADLEGPDWPLAGERFGGVIVTRYLHRPRFDAVLDLVGEGGVLLYETFADGQEALGRPRRPDFLLRSGELLERVRGRLEVVAFEQGCAEGPRPAVLQRIAAIRGNALACILPSFDSEETGGCPGHPGRLRKDRCPTGVPRSEP